MKRAWKWIAGRLVLWNRITFRRPWTMQMSIRPSFLGLIVERRRQKRRMKDL